MYLAKLEAQFLAKKEREAIAQLKERGLPIRVEDGHGTCLSIQGHALTRRTFSMDDLNRLQWCRKLKRLELNGLPLTDQQARFIVHCRELEYLGLESTRISDATLAVIGDLSELQNLYLVETETTDEGIRYLQGLSKLRKLNLARTGITDNGLIYLERLSSLEVVRVAETAVTREGAQRLREALPNCHIAW